MAAGFVLMTAVAGMSATPAHAQDDPLAGQWAVKNDANEEWIFEIRPVGGDEYAGRVVQKSTDATICWPVGEDVMRVSGRDRHYQGRITLYAQGSGCTDEAEGGIVIDVDASGNLASVVLTECDPNPDGTGCEPQTWSRAGPLVDQSVVPRWLVPGAVVLAVALVVVVIIVVVVIRGPRARRKRAKQQHLPAHVTLQPRPGEFTAPAVHVPPVPGITIRIEPRIELTEPVVQEVLT